MHCHHTNKGVNSPCLSLPSLPAAVTTVTPTSRTIRWVSCLLCMNVIASGFLARVFNTACACPQMLQALLSFAHGMHGNSHTDPACSLPYGSSTTRDTSTRCATKPSLLGNMAAPEFLQQAVYTAQATQLLLSQNMHPSSTSCTQANVRNYFSIFDDVKKQREGGIPLAQPRPNLPMGVRPALGMMGGMMGGGPPPFRPPFGGPPGRA